MKKFLSFLMVALTAIAVSASGLASLPNGVLLRENEQVLADYSAEPLVLGWDAAGQINILSDGGTELKDAGAEVGDYLRVYLAVEPGFNFQVWEGHWGVQYFFPYDVNIEKVPDGGDLALEAVDGMTHVDLELTEDVLNAAYTTIGWGGAFLLQGASSKILKACLVHPYPVVEDETVLADYSAEPLVLGWDAAGQINVLSDGGAELKDAGAEVGDRVRVYLAVDPGFNFQVWEGHWASQYMFPYDVNIEKVPDGGDLALEAVDGVTYVDITLTEDVLNAAYTTIGWGGVFLLQGASTKILKACLVQDKQVLVDEDVIFTFETPVALGWDAAGQINVLSDGGTELKEAGAEVGDVVKFHLDVDPGFNFQVWEGHWASQYMFPYDVNIEEVPDGGDLALEAVDGKVVLPLTLTEDILTAAYTTIGWGGVFLLQGANTKIDKVSLQTVRPATKDTIFADHLEIVNAYVEYNGGDPVLPEYKIYNLDSTRLLKAGKDFDIVCVDNTELGNAHATITGKGSWVGELSFNYTIVAKTATEDMVKCPATVAFYDQAVEPEIVITCGPSTLEKDVDYTVTFADNEAVGTASYTLVFKGKYIGTLNGTFEIVAPKTITAEMVSVADEGLSYTAEAVEPQVTVKDGDKELVLDTDYTIEYANNVEVTEEASVVVKGINLYTGEYTHTFAIAPKTLTAEMIELPAYRYIFDGKTVAPLVTVMANNATLIEGTDYDVQYLNNDHVSDSAKVVVTGKGSYTGTPEKGFLILESATKVDELTITVQDTAYVFDGSEMKPAVTVMNGEAALEADKDYKVEYANNVNVTDSASVKVTLLGTYAGDTTFYYAIAKKDASAFKVEFEKVNFYTGEAVEPAVAVKNGSTELVAGTDYKVEYADNVEETEAASLKVTYMGNYSGEYAAVFTIVKTIDLTEAATLTLAEKSFVYTGAEIKPEFVLTIAREGLTYEIEQDTIYAENINVTSEETKATVTIQFKGVYTGTVSAEFAITPKAATAEMVSFVKDEIEYTGAQIEAEVAVKDNDVELKNGVDYTVSYRGNVELGTGAEAKVEFKGNYSGTVVKTFSIVAKAYNDKDFELAIEDGVYSGEEYTPEVTILYGNFTLIQGEDFTVTYSNNVEVGEAAVEIVFQGNFSGTTTAPYYINARVLAREMVTIEGNEFDFTGEAIEPAVTVKDAELDYELQAGVDYTLEYVDNVKGGMASVLVIGQNHYEGRVRLSFYIYDPEGFEQIVSDGKAVKFVMDGQLYIQLGERTIDAQGRVVK